MHQTEILISNTFEYKGGYFFQNGTNVDQVMTVLVLTKCEMQGGRDKAGGKF